MASFSKLSLHPLFLSLEAFLKARRDVRADILKLCAVENVAIKKLLISNPFVPKIFDKACVNDLSNQALNLSKSLLDLLGFFSKKGKRKAGYQGRARGYKRARGGYTARLPLNLDQDNSILGNLNVSRAQDEDDQDLDDNGTIVDPPEIEEQEQIPFNQ